MKSIISGLIITLIIMSSCNSYSANTSTKGTPQSDNNVSAKSQYVPPAGVEAKVTSTVKSIVDGYLHLKNALAKNNSQDAAVAGNEILLAIGKVDTLSMTVKQLRKYNDLADDIKENAEHISENGGKIEHQREHFEMLSKDVYDLVKTFGGGQILYQDYCPMYNGQKGASWLSETKEINNPYMGKGMSTCGEVKEELK